MARLRKGQQSLLITHPVLSKEWDYEKNAPITPNEVSAGSNQLYWWKGECGHSFSMRVYCRTEQMQKCPYCSGRKILIGFNDLSTVNPDLAKEWHPTKNGNLKPTDVTAKSKKLVWWKGICGHEWQSIVKSRSNQHGCPICTGRKIERGINDLATTNPELLSEWNYSKNEIEPTEVAAGTKRKVWWRCNKGHEWYALIPSRSDGHGCPYCSGRKVLPGFNDLTTRNPELAAEWDYEKNGDLTPDKVALKTHKKVWWKGACGHSWCAAVSERSSGCGCTICAKEQTSSFPEQAILYYIKQLFPDAINNDRHLIIELDIYIPSQALAIEYDGSVWHTDKKRDISKNNICITNGIKLIRIREQGLPILDSCICIQRQGYTDDSLNDAIVKLLSLINSEHVIQVDVNTDRIKIYNQYIKKRKANSLLELNPEVAKEWHSYKNGELTPLMVSNKSNKKIWWTCSKCGYDWQAIVINRTAGHGCPKCGGRIATQKSIKTRLKKNTFEEKHPEIAKEWHPTKNNSLMPDMVTSGSNQMVWWLGSCGHEWQTKVGSRARGSGCPYCSKRSVIAGETDLLTMNPALASEWNYEKNQKCRDKYGRDISTPDKVSAGSNLKVWWKCAFGHEWEATIDSRNVGNGCPYCSGRYVLKGSNDLLTTNSKIAKEWHPTKNGDLKPSDVTTKSHKNVWWLGSCGHEWQAKVGSRTGKNHSGCPYCSGHKVLPGFNDLATINPNLIKEWDYVRNTTIKPEDVTRGSTKKVWWKCQKGHSWQASINKRSSGRGCPYCCGLNHPPIMCVETGEVFAFASDAHKSMGVDVGSINRCCKGEMKSAGGYHWKYIDT